MELQLILAMATFAFVSSFTPGPNNLMLLASGANFGFRRTVPHMLGIVLGFALLLGVILAGLGELFTHFPVMQTTLKIMGSAYLLWLAWKIARTQPQNLDSGHQDLAPETTGAHANTQPMTLWQAALFQFVNPKAWMTAIAGVSSLTLPSHYWFSGLLLIAVFLVINLHSTSLWAGFGVAIKRLLRTEKRQRYFNWGMGALTAATVLMIIG